MKNQGENEGKKLCLPDEVWIHIISTLPLPSICVIRRVSKTWYNMMSGLFKANPEYVKPLLTNIVILGNKCGPSRNLFMAEFYVTRDNPGAVTVTSPDVYDLGCEYRPVASCNGLVLLVDCYDVNPTYFVSNPIIGQYIKLPLQKYTKGRRYFCGFGFCPSTNLYKVIQFHYQEGKSTVVEVHTLGTSTWRDTQIVPPELLNNIVSWTRGITGTYLNGALHWRADGIVYRFNLETEQFNSIDAPGFEVVIKDKKVTFLGATRRNLYVSVHSPGVLDVFLLRCSWTKEFSLSVPHMDKRFEKCDIKVINYGDGTNIIILGSHDIESLDFYLMATNLRADVENVVSVEKMCSRYYPAAYSPNFTSLSDAVPGQIYQMRFPRSISRVTDSQTKPIKVDRMQQLQTQVETPKF